MTPHRLSRLLLEQTIQARKVFDALLVDESLTIHQIRAVLVARGRHMAHNIIEGCLHSLGRVGLVITNSGRFRAAFDASQPYGPSQESDKDTASMTTSLEITIHQTATVPVYAPTSVQAAPAAAQEVPNPIQAATDRIAAIAGEVVEVVEGVRQQLRQLTSLSTELDELAIQITLETDQVNDKIQKLAQVQALLRDLGVAA